MDDRLFCRFTRTVGRYTGVLALLLLSACGNNVPALAPLAAGAKILAFGDELTAGLNVSEAQRYPAVLAQLSGHPVLNAGVPGEQLGVAVKRFSALLDAEKPGLVVLCHGGYKTDSERDVVETIEHFRTLINAANQRKISLVLLAIPEFSPGLPPAAFYKKLGRAFDLPQHGALLSRVLGEHATMDEAHGLPNAQGYRLLAEGVQDLLQQAKALPVMQPH
jgi:acyl-CoA thioesterase I